MIVGTVSPWLSLAILPSASASRESILREKWSGNRGSRSTNRSHSITQLKGSTSVWPRKPPLPVKVNSNANDADRMTRPGRPKLRL